MDPYAPHGAGGFTLRGPLGTEANHPEFQDGKAGHHPQGFVTAGGIRGGLKSLDSRSPLSRGQASRE